MSIYYLSAIATATRDSETSTCACSGTSPHRRSPPLYDGREGGGSVTPTVAARPSLFRKPLCFRRFRRRFKLRRTRWTWHAHSSVTRFLQIRRGGGRTRRHSDTSTMMGEKWGRPNEERTDFGGLSRSALMSRVRSRGNRTTELRMVGLLEAQGILGWIRHASLAGSPDFCWPKEKVALFVHGCFWHGHTCGRNVSPKSNQQAWLRKISGNRRRDRRCALTLRQTRWSVLTVWECQLRPAVPPCLRRIEKTLAKRRRNRTAS